jgi:hypothetical protein
MSGMSELYLDWCSHKAAKYAVTKWHYSGTMPFGKALKIGVWEDDIFIGAIVYARGVSKNIGSPFDLTQTEVCELQRVALNDHDNHVSKMLSISRSMVSDQSPGIKCLVSYADSNQGHHGGIYRADNWYYIGKTGGKRFLSINGKQRHTRSVGKEYGTHSIKKLKKILQTEDIEYVEGEPKYKYAYPLTDRIEQKLKQMSQPYP